MKPSQDEDPLTYEIIGAAIEVHRSLGAGLLEELYEAAFCIELEHRQLKYERQRHVDVVYKGRNIGDMYVDIVVEDTVVVELKSVKSLTPIHTAQLMTYLKLLNLKKGLLNCIVLDYNGTVFKEQKAALWDRYSTLAPQRLRQPAEQYKIVKRA